MLNTDPFEQHVFARVREFADPQKPWNRRLWMLGSVLTLEEAIRLHEQPGVFDGPRRRARDTARDIIQGDPGVGAGPELGRLLRLLKLKEIAEGSPELLGLRLLLEDAGSGYLTRWASALRAGRPYGDERTARHLAAHILDSGVSAPRLAEWLDAKRDDQATTYSLADVCELAQEELVDHDDETEVLVLFTQYSVIEKPRDWIAKGAVPNWLTSHGHDPATFDFEYFGGLALTVRAPDRYTAVGRVRDLLEGYRSRVAIGAETRERFEHHAKVWCSDGFVQPLERRRSGDVATLAHASRLFANPGENAELEGALELISLLRTATAPAAAAASWAGIENMLKIPSDSGAHLAVDRLAILIAGSWPQAELASLAASRAGGTDAFAVQLRAANSDRDKARLMAAHLDSGGAGPWSGEAEVAAAKRMTDLFANKTKTLQAVAKYASSTISRLYRERNVVMHGGLLEAEGMRATLRVAEPLIGAGFDRLTDALLVRGIGTMRFVAKAATAVELADSRSPEELCDLLE